MLAGLQAAYDAQFKFCVLMLNDKLSCQHVVRISIWIQWPNNGAQFDKCRLLGCTKFALIKMLKCKHSIQYEDILTKMQEL